MDEVGSPSVRLAGTTLGEQRHVCAFFRTHDEQYRALLPFVKEGLDRGEKAFHIVDPALRTDHLDRLKAGGIDVQRAEASGQLELRTWEETYLRDGRFDQHAMLVLVEQVLQEARAHGFSLTRLVAHMGWALEDRPGVGDLVEYEARANAILARYDDPVVCVYDGAKVTVDLADDVLRTHPVVISDEALHANPHFVAPDTLLRQIAAGRSPAREKPRSFTARCVFCQHVILAGVPQIRDAEVEILREHLRACRRTVPMDRHRDEGISRVLQNYQVTEDGS